MPYKANKPENLIPLTQRSEEEAREIRRKGALASTESKKKRKLLREVLEEMLGTTIKLKDPDGNESVITRDTAIALGLFQRAQKGDPRAFEVIRDTLGEKPAERVITETTINPPSIKEVFDFHKELEALQDED